MSRPLATILGEAVAQSSLDTCFSGLTAAFIEHLVALGVPVDGIQLPFCVRGGFFHPELSSVVMHWDRASGTIEEVETDHDTFDDMRWSSPYAAFDAIDAPMVRFRLGAGTLPEAPALKDYAAQGHKECVFFRIPMPTGAGQRLTIATRRSGGFSALDLALVQGTFADLSLALYAAYSKKLGLTLAEAYIGPETGRRVLAGSIRRGDPIEIGAVIWFCDIRNFTELSRSLEPRQVIDIVNRTFEAVGGLVTEAGGEILKFVGDAMLAIFPTDSVDDLAALQHRVLDAASRVRDSLAEVTTPDGSPVEVGLGLHLGTVIYGNVGTRSRLDFTVMGHAVNLTSRIEGLTRQLKTSVAISDALAGAGPYPLERLGAYRLKGFDDPQGVWSFPRSPTELAYGDTWTGSVEDISGGQASTPAA